MFKLLHLKYSTLGCYLLIIGLSLAFFYQIIGIIITSIAISLFIKFDDEVKKGIPFFVCMTIATIFVIPTIPIKKYIIKIKTDKKNKQIELLINQERKRAIIIGENILKIPEFTDYYAIDELCKNNIKNYVEDNVMLKCAKSHTEIARIYLDKGELDTARNYIELAKDEYENYDKINLILNQISAEELKLSEIKRVKLEEEEYFKKIRARRDFAEKLRERYLDEGCDIKVYFSDRDSNELHLTFSLFNDVWAHKLRKGDFVLKAYKLGIKRIYISDGDSYNVSL